MTTSSGIEVKVSIDFGGILCKSEVWLNGVKIAEDDYGYLDGLLANVGQQAIMWYCHGREIKGEPAMPLPATALNVNEAKANFSGILAEAESHMATFTIMRYGHPVARIVPIDRKIRIRPLPRYGAKIAIKGDLFADDSSLWENA